MKGPRNENGVGRREEQSLRGGGFQESRTGSRREKNGRGEGERGSSEGGVPVGRETSNTLIKVGEPWPMRKNTNLNDEEAEKAPNRCGEKKSEGGS